MRRRLLPILLAAAAGCRPDCTPRTDAEAPIVVLVTVDTIRADHVTSGPGGRARTPHLDRLAAEGVRFTEAYAAANVTIPSHVSILTSRPLAGHRVLDNRTSQAAPLETLPARFASAGYRTAAFVSAQHVGPQMLFGRILTGLERFDGPRRVSKPYRAEETTDHALAWLRGACRGPAFAWIHLWDPHMPYTPPAPFDRIYYTGDPRDPRSTSFDEVQLDWANYDTSHLRRELQRHPDVVRALKRRLAVNNRAARTMILYPHLLLRQPAPAEVHAGLLESVRGLHADLRRRLPFNPPFAGFLTGVRDVEYPRALYAGEISYVDREIGRLRDTLDAWGLGKRTVLLVTGDHGEGLGDHGLYFAHIGLWEEMLRVPLIVWAPGRLPVGVRRDVVSGLDVAPTLLALAGLAVPPVMEGRDLFASSLAPRPMIAEAVKGTQITLRDGPWKLVRTLEPNWVNDAYHPEAGQVELYDLAADPAERTNRVATNADVARVLGTRLDAWMAAHGIAPDGTGYARASGAPSPAVAEQLRALGYAE